MSARGFTLLEVLVALFVAAVALTAAGRAVGMAVDGEREGRDRQLALWVAKNRLAEHQSAPLMPEIGSREGTARQGDLDLAWKEEVSNTPNPRFRLVRLSVYRAGEPAETRRELARLDGYVARP